MRSMISKPNVSKAKAKRVIRARRRQVGEMTDNASKNIDRHVFRRLSNLNDVGRFIVAWLLLMIVLATGVIYQTRGLRAYYLETQPVSGGLVSEGIVGTYSNPNPLFASTTVDLSVSRLLFSSILAYNSRGELVNDLAETIIRSDDGLTYDVTLKQGVRWHDGTELTAKDIVYTYQAIQNPNTRSPYNVSWQGIKVEEVNTYLARFTLPSALNSFPLSLTNGIVPYHLLGETPFEELRSASFNTRPVGSGPFILSNVTRIDDFETIEKRQRLEFRASTEYFKGAPKLDAFVMYTLSSESDLVEYLETRRIDAAVFNSSPELGADNKYVVEPVPLLAGAYVFFNTSVAPFNSLELRRALVEGTNTNKILAGLGYPVQKVDGPLLKLQPGYDANLTQSAYNPEKAKEALNSLGWVPVDGVRSKDGSQLVITLTTLEGSDFAKIASELQKNWSEDLQIKTNIITKTPSDLQPLLLQKSYGALLYGISLGSDPDVFAYWHSSQAVFDRFNLSMYKSAVADVALESGRSRPDIALRSVKYRPFLEAWRSDAPAIGLYQPPLFYVSSRRIFGMEAQRFNSTADRFSTVHNWQVQTEDRPKVSN